MSKMQRYLVSYRHDGDEWNLELIASNVDDARQRLRSLTLGRIEGQVVAKVPAGLGPLAALAVWVQNLFGRAGSAF